MDKEEAFISLYLLKKNETIDTIKTVSELITKPTFKNSSLVLSYSEFKEWMKDIDVTPMLFHHYIKEVKSIRIPSADIYSFFEEAEKTDKEMIAKLEDYYKSSNHSSKKRKTESGSSGEKKIKTVFEDELDGFQDALLCDGKSESTVNNYVSQVRSTIRENKISDISQLKNYTFKTPVKQFMKYVDSTGDSDEVSDTTSDA